VGLTSLNEFKTILERCGKLLFLFPEIKTCSANERLFYYWRYYDKFGDLTLEPNHITNYHSIDRAFRRIMPEEYKNYKAERVYREMLAKK